MNNFMVASASNPATTDDANGRDRQSSKSSSSAGPEPSNSMSLAFKESSAPALKRLACESCRDRKIRCDRQHPTCGRCAKIGIACRYISRSKSTPSKSELSRYLLAMNQRLQQTEARLALQSMQRPYDERGSRHAPDQDQDESPVMATEGLSNQLPSTRRPSTTAQGLALQTNTTSITAPLDLSDLGMTEEMSSAYAMSDWHNPSGNSDNSLSEFSMDAFAMQIDQGESLLVSNSNQTFQFDPISMDISYPESGHSSPILSSGLLHGLYDKYFELFHPLVPMISRKRFEVEIAKPSPSIGGQALSWAIAALGSFSVPELHRQVDRCYEQCRTLLERCERDDTGASLATIDTLQAIVLLALYEFKQPNFMRSWMTLGRAIRLAKMMGLDQGACCLSGVPAASPWGATLPIPTSPAEAEERRRTYWVIFTFDAFQTMQTGAKSALERPIKMPLPYPTDSPDSLDQSGVLMSPVQHVLDVEEFDENLISSFAGTIIMAWLYRRCNDHITSQVSPNADGAATGSFWETHFAIENSINHCQTSLLARYVNGDRERADDPRSITLRTNLAAIEIILHETALAKVEAGKLPAALTVDAASKCASAASDIAKAVQLGRSLTGKKRETFRQQDRFLVWPMTIAITVLARLSENMDESHTPATSFGFTLKMLCRGMKDLIRPEHMRPGLEEKIDAWLAGEKMSSPEDILE